MKKEVLFVPDTATELREFHSPQRKWISVEENDVKILFN